MTNSYTANEELKLFEIIIAIVNLSETDNKFINEIISEFKINNDVEDTIFKMVQEPLNKNELFEKLPLLIKNDKKFYNFINKLIKSLSPNEDINDLISLINSCSFDQYKNFSCKEYFTKKMENTEANTLTNPALYGGLQDSSNKVANNVVLNANQGHGYAAEKMNHMNDIINGKNAEIIGGDNAKNGADRLVDGAFIQSKYCKTGSRCINECFDKETKIFKYLDQNGDPMLIEVPSDKYEDAIKAMEDKIKSGKVPGVTNPDDAKKLVKKGAFTYQQAVNMAKFGTIESLTYDAINGVRLAGTTMGISAIISFSLSLWNGEELNSALKKSAYTGLKIGGISWATSILAAQLGRTGLEKVLRESTDYIVRKLGPKICSYLANGLRESGKIYGAAAMNNVSKILRGNIITGIATTIVLSVPDFVKLFQSRISGKQIFKNITKTSCSVAGGTVGWMGGASIGASVGSTFPVIGTSAGALVGGLIGSFSISTVSYKATDSILSKYIEDDAKEMKRILENEFGKLSSEYLLNEHEAKQVIDELIKEDLADILLCMYASSNREEFINSHIENIIIGIVEQRKDIQIPNNINELLIDSLEVIFNEDKAKKHFKENYMNTAL